MRSNPITIFIIDDEFPKTEEFIERGVYNSAISSDDLYHLTTTKDWRAQQPLQQLIKDIISSKTFTDGMIKLWGFTQPPQVLTNLESSPLPDLIIYDWEYGMPQPLESQKWLLGFFEKTNAFIFVYSQVRNELPEFLNKSVFDEYAPRFQLFLKGSSDNYIFSSEEFILQYILSRVSSNYQIKLQGIEVNFSDNGYLENPSDILHLEKILGRNFIIEQLKQLEFTLNQKTIEQLLQNANGKVLFNTEKNLLITSDSTLMIKKINPQKELSYLDVLKSYGLLKLKELLESGYVKL